MEFNGAVCFDCGLPIRTEMTTAMRNGTFVVVHKGQCPRDKNTALSEKIDHHSTLKENTMAENPTVTATTVPTEETVQLNRLQKFVIDRPRLSRALAITGAAGTALGGLMLANTLQANRKHVSAAVDHVALAGTELSASVTPQEPTES